MKPGLNLPWPRLLPLTIAAMSALLVLKVTALANLAIGERPVAPHGAPVEIGPPALIVAQALAETAPETPQPAPAPTPPMAPPGKADALPVSDSERELLQDLRTRRGELDARQTALDARQAVLDATEKRLAARVQELTSLQTRLEALETARKQRDEANWAGLTKMYEVMKPRDAAAIFNDLEMPILLQILDRMKETKMAPVIAAMQTDRAREATAKLAEMRLRQNTIGAAPPAGG